jgi:hypothetical protein
MRQRRHCVEFAHALTQKSLERHLGVNNWDDGSSKASRRNRSLTLIIAPKTRAFSTVRPSPPLQSGQRVKTRLLPEGIVVTDIYWSDEDYRFVFSEASLRVSHIWKPTAPQHESGWLDETKKSSLRGL